MSVSEVGSGDSHHLEVLVPEDLQVNYISLRAKKYFLANEGWNGKKIPLDYSFARSVPFVLECLPVAITLPKAPWKTLRQGPGA